MWNVKKKVTIAALHSVQVNSESGEKEGRIKKKRRAQHRIRTLEN